MRVFRLPILSILVLSVLPQTRSLDIEIAEITDIFKFGYELGRDILENWDLLRPKKPGDQEDENAFPFVKPSEKRVVNKIKLLTRKIDSLNSEIQQSSYMVMERVLDQLPKSVKLDRNLDELRMHISHIEHLYNKFGDFSMTNATYEEDTLKKFADTLVSENIGQLSSTLAAIHELLVPSQRIFNNEGILRLLAVTLDKAANEMCYEQQSPQQILYSLYNSIALAEVKGYVMMQFSWKLKKHYGDGSYVNEMRQVLRDYQHRTSSTMREIKTAMTFAPRDLWKCDPTVHREDVTFSQLNHVFQGYVVNEVDMNDKNTCRENCGYYNYAKVYGCFKNQYCSQQRTCNGKIVGCQYVDSDMWICPAEKNSNRRYEYIEYENGQVLGEKGTCTRGTTKVDSWWRWLFWHCSYCFCYCDENTDDSERHWNLREVVSDVANNKVITGLRLRKVNKIVHVQIQEGVLLPQGKIDQSTIQWKPIENYTILDSDVSKGIDYHTFDWNKRAVDLDDLRLPNTAVLTGIKFKLIGTRLNLEIQGTPFNFTSGKLLREKVQWHSNDNTERTELKIEKPDIPTKLDLGSEPDTKMNQYLNFAPTDLQKDAAQSTIPFLDIQDVVSVPPIPFGGAGIFHKGRTGSGGFLTMKLLTYDFTPHLHVDLPPPPSLLESRDNEVHVN